MDNNVTTVELNVNGAKAAKTLDDLKARANKLQEAIGKAVSEGNKKGYKELDKELKRVNKEMKAIISTTANVENVMRKLDKASPRELQETLKILNKQLNNMERGSAAWEAQARKIKLVDAELKKVNAELKESKSWYDRLSVQINHYGLSLMSAIAGLTGIVQAGKKAVLMYAEMDQEMANVRKFTGMTADEVERLNETFKKINTRSSREQLNQLAQEAGRLGLQSEEDVLGFVKAADKINVALNDLGEGATLTISKLTDIFGDKERLGVEKSMLAVGSAINELSQNSTASAPYLAEFAQRLAGVGAQAKLTIPQIMGFGAVLDSQGQAVEMSATALSKLVMNLFKQADKIAAATGLNLQKFKDLAAKDTNEALLVLLQRLHELGNMDALAPLFAEMGENGVRSSQVLAALAGNIDLVRKQQLAANIAFEDAVSIDKEFNVQNTTVQARLEKSKKNFHEMAITLGKGLMPIVSHMLSGTSMLMKMMLKTIQFIKEYRTVIVSSAAAIAAYTVVVELSTIKTKLQSAAVAIATAAQKAWNAAIRMNPWGAILAVVVAATTAIIMQARKVRELSVAEKAEADARKKITEQYAEQRSKIDMLNAAVHNETLKLNARKKALEELQALCPDYHASLTEEGKLINDNTVAIDNYLAALEKEIQAQVYREKLEELYRQRVEANEKVETSLSLVNQAQKNYDDSRDRKRPSYSVMGSAGYNFDQDDQILRQRQENLKAAKKELADIDEAIKKIGAHVQDVPDLLLGNLTDIGLSNYTDGEHGKSDDGSTKNRFEEEDKWLAEQMALNQIAYYQGEKTYTQYTGDMIDIERQYHEKRLAKCEEGSLEYLQVEAELRKAEFDQRKHWDGLTLEQVTLLYDEQLKILEDSYNQGKLSARQYQIAKEDAELEHLKNIVNIYEEGSREYIKAQENLEKRERQIQNRRLTEAKRIQEEIRKKYFIGNDVMSDEDYELSLQNLDLVRAQLLSNQSLTNEERLEIERAYELARYELAIKCNKQISEDTVKSSYVAGANISKFFSSKKFQKSWAAVGMIMSSIKDAMSAATEGIEAECERQVAAIEARYDREIKAAGSNEERVAELEKRKEQEISAVRADANKKTFGINVAMAIADSAMAIVEAWKGAMELGPIAGPIMGALLTALITGVTAANIATMKKQQNTAAGFYAKGRKGGPAEYAIVGEEGPELMYLPQGASIIPNNKIQSPSEWENFGVPVAKRINTIGSLSPADVSGSITANQRLADSGMSQQTQQVMMASSVAASEQVKATRMLVDTLKKPLAAITTVTGDKGIRQAQRNYDKLMKNKSK